MRKTIAERLLDRLDREFPGFGLKSRGATLVRCRIGRRQKEAWQPLWLVHGARLVHDIGGMHTMTQCLKAERLRIIGDQPNTREITICAEPDPETAIESLERNGVRE
jgi:hypothetical protein